MRAGTRKTEKKERGGRALGQEWARRVGEGAIEKVDSR